MVSRMRLLRVMVVLDRNRRRGRLRSLLLPARRDVLHMLEGEALIDGPVQTLRRKEALSRGMMRVRCLVELRWKVAG